jgi:flagellar export protein FliJ
VLDYRTEQLNKIQQKVAEEEQKRASLFNRIREFDVAIEQALHEQQAFHQGSLNPVQLQHFPNFLWRLKQDRFQSFQALQAQEQRLLAVRQELQQAMIKKKSLDILKDKDLTQYRKQIEKAEEEFLAEIAINRAVRNSRTLA